MMKLEVANDALDYVGPRGFRDNHRRWIVGTEAASIIIGLAWIKRGRAAIDIKLVGPGFA